MIFDAIIFCKYGSLTVFFLIVNWYFYSASRVIARILIYPKIDIAFHNVLILAFWGYFSESDTDVDHHWPVRYVIQRAHAAEETFVRAKISFET